MVNFKASRSKDKINIPQQFKGRFFCHDHPKFLAKVFAYYYFCRRTVHYLLVRDDLLVNLFLLFSMHYSSVGKKHKLNC